MRVLCLRSAARNEWYIANEKALVMLLHKHGVEVVSLDPPMLVLDKPADWYNRNPINQNGNYVSNVTAERLWVQHETTRLDPDSGPWAYIGAIVAEISRSGSFDAVIGFHDGAAVARVLEHVMPLLLRSFQKPRICVLWQGYHLPQMQGSSSRSSVPTVNVTANRGVYSVETDMPGLDLVRDSIGTFREFGHVVAPNEKVEMVSEKLIHKIGGLLIRYGSNNTATMGEQSGTAADLASSARPESASSPSIREGATASARDGSEPEIRGLTATHNAPPAPIPLVRPPLSADAHVAIPASSESASTASPTSHVQTTANWNLPAALNSPAPRSLSGLLPSAASAEPVAPATATASVPGALPTPSTANAAPGVAEAMLQPASLPQFRAEEPLAESTVNSGTLASDGISATPPELARAAKVPTAPLLAGGSPQSFGSATSHAPLAQPSSTYDYLGKMITVPGLSLSGSSPSRRSKNSSPGSSDSESWPFHFI